MTTLEEDLAELRDRLPQLPDALLGLVHDAERLAATASNLVAQLGAARDDAARSAAAVRSAGERTESTLDALRDDLRASADAVASAWDAGRDELQDAAQRLRDASDAAQGEGQECREELAGRIGEWIAQLAEGAVDVATDAVLAEARATVDRLDAAGRDVAEHWDGLRAVLGELGTDLHADATALAFAHHESAQGSKARALDLLGVEFRQRMDDDAPVRAAVTAEIQGQSERLLQELDARLRSVREPASNASGAAASGLLRLREALAAAASGAVAAGNAVTDGLDAIGEATAPLPDVDAEVQATVTRISVSGR
jgi:chromosome segregation ATPase